MFINKNKERATNLTGNIIITATIFTVQAKNIYFKVKLPDIFLSDRKKFKAYEIQCRIYLWANRKKGN
jgi:hypothetical protein